MQRWTNATEFWIQNDFDYNNFIIVIIMDELVLDRNFPWVLLPAELDDDVCTFDKCGGHISHWQRHYLLFQQNRRALRAHLSPTMRRFHTKNDINRHEYLGFFFAPTEWIHSIRCCVHRSYPLQSNSHMVFIVISFYHWFTALEWVFCRQYLVIMTCDIDIRYIVRYCVLCNR